MATKQNKIYKLQEEAENLGETKKTRYNNISKGNLKLHKMGGTYRITEEQLQDILKNGYNGKENK